MASLVSTCSTAREHASDVEIAKYLLIQDGKVVFCTGGSGSICSAQVRALVRLGANACIVGRQIEKTARMAESIATARVGAKVLGYGAVDVRDIKVLEDAAQKCAKELGGIDFVM